MRQRDRDGRAALVSRPDAFGHAPHAEQASGGEPADRHDQLRLQQPQLVVAPELAQVLLDRGRRPVAAAGRVAAGVAAGDGGAVEGRVEDVLVQLEPPAQRLAGSAPPRQPLLALDDARRLRTAMDAAKVKALEEAIKSFQEAGEADPTQDVVFGNLADSYAEMARVKRGDEQQAAFW